MAHFPACVIPLAIKTREQPLPLNVPERKRYDVQHVSLSHDSAHTLTRPRCPCTHRSAHAQLPHVTGRRRHGGFPVRQPAEFSVSLRFERPICITFVFATSFSEI